VHHVETRADGGEHDANNLLTLCGAHHRAAHEGRLIITGSAATRLDFWHADAAAYGALPAAPVAEVQAMVFQALRGLGFGERDVKSAMKQASEALPPSLSLEQVVRHCLAVLTERSWSYG
jgi:Holliday junction resolvasome RuvABC DNA-binding subunit